MAKSLTVRHRAEELSSFAVRKIRRSISSQGHVLTGRLVNSIEGRVSYTDDGIEIDFTGESYGRSIESGVNRRKVPFSPGSGRGRSSYIEGLTRYARLRGMTLKPGQTYKSIAFAIAHSHKKRGMPTFGSRKFSRTGRRTGAILEAIQDNKQEIKKRVDLVSEAYIDSQVSDMLERVTSRSSHLKLI